MKRKVSIMAMTVAMIMVFVGAAHALVVEYTDRTSGTAWQDWYGAGSNKGFYSYNYQPFDAVFSFGLAPANQKTFVPVPTPGLDMGTVNTLVTTNNGFSGSSMLQTTVIPNGNTARFDFKGSTWAVGGVWDLGNFDTSYTTGLTIKFFLDGGSSSIANIVQDTVINNQPEFWGWTSDVKILAMEVSAAGVDAQGFTLQQLEYQAVPEPSTIVLLGLGIGGLAFLRRRK